MFISRQTYEGFKISAFSAVKATIFVFQVGMQFVLTEQFCQDPAEEYLGNQRKIGNVYTPFKNYLTRVSHNVKTRNSFSSIELPKTKLEFGRRSFLFLGASIFNSLPAAIRTLNSRLLFRQKTNEYFYL